jgi:hypothetical protein
MLNRKISMIGKLFKTAQSVTLPAPGTRQARPFCERPFDIERFSYRTIP